MTGVPISAFLPAGILLAAALLIFLLDVVGVRRSEALGGISVAATLAALVGVVADLGFAPFAALRTVPAGVVDAVPSTTALFAFTSLGLVFQAIFLLSAFFVGLGSLSRPSDERGAAIFFGLLLIATTGMLLVALSADLFFLLLAIEVVGISTYLMVGYTRRDGRALEAAMKFYIIGALSTALSFFGASLLFGAYGSTNLEVLSQAPGTVGYPAMALAGYALLIAGVGFKATLVPFHAWGGRLRRRAHGRHGLPLRRIEEDRHLRPLPHLRRAGHPALDPVRHVRRQRLSGPVPLRPDPRPHLRGAGGPDHDRGERPRAPPEGDEADARLLLHQPGRLHAHRDRGGDVGRLRGGYVPGLRPRVHEGRGVPRGRRGRPDRDRPTDQRLEGARGPAPEDGRGVRAPAPLPGGDPPHGGVRLEVRPVLLRGGGAGMVRLARRRGPPEQRPLGVLLRPGPEGDVHGRPGPGARRVPPRRRRARVRPGRGDRPCGGGRGPPRRLPGPGPHRDPERRGPLRRDRGLGPWRPSTWSSWGRAPRGASPPGSPPRAAPGPSSWTSGRSSGSPSSAESTSPSRPS